LSHGKRKAVVLPVERGYLANIGLEEEQLNGKQDERGKYLWWKQVLNGKKTLD
jgi:hypothetical protein